MNFSSMRAAMFCKIAEQLLSLSWSGFCSSVQIGWSRVLESGVNSVLWLQPALCFVNMDQKDQKGQGVA